MPTYKHMPEIDGASPDAGVFHCFETLAPVLLTFASRHSLLVQKYYKDQPMWSFHFLHPKGGFGMVQIHAAPLGGSSFAASVASHWWIDDEERCQRSALSTNPVSFEATRPEEIGPVLDNTLAYLLGLTPADLKYGSATSPRARDTTCSYVYSEFEQAQRLPT